MKIKLLQEYNTPHAYIAAGTVCERPNKQAKDMIAAGIAKAVNKKEANNATNR